MKFTTTGLAQLPAMALSAALLLAACGGENADAPAESRAIPLTIAPLIDDEGNVMPSDPSAVPANHRSRWPNPLAQGFGRDRGVFARAVCSACRVRPRPPQEFGCFR